MATPTPLDVLVHSLGADQAALVRRLTHLLEAKSLDMTISGRIKEVRACDYGNLEKQMADNYDTLTRTEASGRSAYNQMPFRKQRIAQTLYVISEFQPNLPGELIPRHVKDLSADRALQIPGPEGPMDLLTHTMAGNKQRASRDRLVALSAKVRPEMEPSFCRKPPSATRFLRTRVADVPNRRARLGKLLERFHDGEFGHDFYGEGGPHALECATALADEIAWFDQFSFVTEPAYYAGRMASDYERAADAQKLLDKLDSMLWEIYAKVERKWI